MYIIERVEINIGVSNCSIKVDAEDLALPGAASGLFARIFITERSQEWNCKTHGIPCKSEYDPQVVFGFD